MPDGFVRRDGLVHRGLQDFFDFFVEPFLDDFEFAARGCHEPFDGLFIDTEQEHLFDLRDSRRPRLLLGSDIFTCEPNVSADGGFRDIMPSGEPSDLVGLNNLRKLVDVLLSERCILVDAATRFDALSEFLEPFAERFVFDAELFEQFSEPPFRDNAGQGFELLGGFGCREILSAISHAFTLSRFLFTRKGR